MRLIFCHIKWVSITKLRFDKSPNIIMGGERNGPTQLEMILWLTIFLHQNELYYLELEDYIAVTLFDAVK